MEALQSSVYRQMRLSGTGHRPGSCQRPNADIDAKEVRLTLRRQLGECLMMLQRLEDGIGALCRITMRVNALGKIDLYQWLFFLAQHARRHLQEMAAIEAEYQGRNQAP